jgi:diguanylate cyclase (GGDEF)-like protein/PAS domain S-box-containing protein
MCPEPLPTPSSFDWLSLLQEPSSAHSSASGASAPHTTSIFEHIHDAFIALDQDGRFIYLNSRAEQMLKRSGAELLGQQVWDVFPGGLESPFYAEYQRAMATKAPTEFEVCHPFFNGWIEVRAFHSPHGWAVFMRDITPRKDAQTALQRQNGYMAALHASALAIMNHLDVEAALQTIIAHVATLLDTTHGFVYLIDPGGATMTLRVGAGLACKHVGQYLHLGEGLAGKVWQNGQPQVVGNYMAWPDRVADFVDDELTMVAGVPLVVNGTVIGVLGVGSSDPGRSFREELTVLERFASLAAIALDNASLYTAAQHELQERRRIEQSLREKEVRYRALFEHTNDGILIFDLSAVIVAANKQIAAMLGCSEAELIGRTLVDNVVPREQAAAMQKFHALLAGQSLPIFERTFITKTGAELPVEISTALVRDAQGTPLHVQSIIRNIARRKQAEADLRESEERYRRLVELSPDGIMVHSDRKVMFANPAAVKLLGATRADDLLGKDVMHLIHPDSRSAVHQRIKHVYSELEPLAPLEHKLVKLDGSVIDVDVTGMPIMFDGKPAVQVIIRDITQRKQAEQTAREASMRFRAIVESLSEGLFMTDPNDVVLYVNQQMAELTGYSVEEMLGKPAYTLLLPPEEWSTMQQNNQRRMQGIAERYEVQIRRKDGTYRWIDVNATPLRDSAGEIVATLGAMTDISARKRAEQRSTAFGSLGQQLSSATTADAAARIIATVADELLGWDAYSLSLYNAEDDMMHDVLNMDVVDGKRTEVASPIASYTPGYTSRYVMTEGPLLLLREHPALNHYELVAFGNTARPSASLMFVPIKRDSQMIGVLTVQSYTLNAYTHDDLHTLQALADHCSGALERIHAEAALRHAEARYRDMVENASDIIYVHDLHGTLLAVNTTAERLSGYTRAEIVGESLARFLAPESWAVVQAVLSEDVREDRQFKPFEIDLRRKDGTLLPVEVNARLLCDDGKPVAVEGIARDITERRRAEATIRHMAFYDALTGLPNRVLFNDYLRNALALAKRHERSLAVLFIDLDRFKFINDSLGHHTGDLLLQAVTQRLTECVREGDTVARMGGDEFTILLPDVDGAPDAADVAQRLLNALLSPFLIGSSELFVSTSIGISMYPTDGDDAETLLKHADTAMYRAKDQGRNGYQFYVPAMNLATHKQYKLEQRLRRALEREEFQVFYQPRVELASCVLVGVEALLRWQHPDLGLIGPDDFITLAEETGLIVPIGEWVLRTACMQAKAWHATHGALFRVAVNLSARQLQQVDLTEHVAAVLEETGLDAGLLEFEITESMAMLNAQRTVVVLRALKDLGVHLSVDDFGTGYSSLSYLKQLSLDTLKIDQSFVHDLAGAANDTAIAEAIIALAHTLNLSVTAEGVETEQQLRFLQNHGCDEAQGYLIGRPMPSNQFEELYLPTMLRRKPPRG